MIQHNSKSKKLHLHDFHLSNSAKITEFAGWEMPVSYGSAVEEHLHTRRKASLFDVSHMGEFGVKGKDTEALISWICSNSITKMVDMHVVQYGMSNGSDTLRWV